MGPILYAHEHKYKIFILQALSTICTCAYIRDFTVQRIGEVVRARASTFYLKLIYMCQFIFR